MKVETTIQEAATKGKSGWNIELGKLGESKAYEFLEQAGWQILSSNWRSGRFGEIDLIARDSTKLLVFCEIKTRLLDYHQTIDFGIHNEGFEAVHWKKQRKIMTCAMNYMRYYNNREKACRFDVISVEYRLPAGAALTSGRTCESLAQVAALTPVIRHVQGAFS